MTVWATPRAAGLDREQSRREFVVCHGGPDAERDFEQWWELGRVEGACGLVLQQMPELAISEHPAAPT